MGVVAIDRTKGTRKAFTCPHALSAEIAAWREAQRPIEMSESQAIAALLWQALLRWRAEQEAEAEPKP
jgi:hypothetical protein